MIESGLLYGMVLSLVALGVMIPFRLLNFPDLTAEGAYPLGGALTAALLIHHVPPMLAIVLATLAGGLLGVGTAYLHLRFRLNTLLSGIILSTMIYSVNLRLMGKPNVPLFDVAHLFSGDLLALLALNAALFALGYLLLNTHKGLRFRAVGLNPHCAEKLGVPLARYILCGLFIGNALSALAGSLIVQVQHYGDIGMGFGIVIHALAALMVGESLIGNQTLLKQVLAPLIGALIYQQIQGLALSLGLAPTDLKFITGGIVLLAISFKQFGQRQYA
ncbi:MAG: ABC transporter permease [Candidatus Berkiella sp.]